MMIDEERDIIRFASGDETAAFEAISRLTPFIRTFLHRRLARILASAEMREDAIQMTLVKLWGSRSSYRYQGVKAWWGYIAVTGKRCALNLIVDPTIELNDYADAPDIGFDPEEAALLYRAADEYFLGLDPRVNEAGRRERLFVAQLYFLRGQDVARLNDFLGTHQVIPRSTLDQWLTHEPTQLHLVYTALYLDTWVLIGRLLSPEWELRADQVQRLFETAQREQKSNKESWDRVTMLAFRYKFAMIEKNLEVRFPGLSKSEFEQDTLYTGQIFEQIMIKVSSKLTQRGAKADLCHHGLWQRLAFQYWYFDELRHGQIMERCQLPSEKVGYRLTLAMLNGWLSSRRLEASLKKYMEASHV